MIYLNLKLYALRINKKEKRKTDWKGVRERLVVFIFVGNFIFYEYY